MKAYGKKEKGRRLELKVAQKIREYGLDPNARRMPGSGAFVMLKTDQLNCLPWSIECKNQETVRLWEWWEQARGSATVAKPPVLIVGGNFRPILSIMNLDDWLNLLLENKQLQELLEDLKLQLKKYEQ